MGEGTQHRATSSFSSSSSCPRDSWFTARGEESGKRGASRRFERPSVSFETKTGEGGERKDLSPFRLFDKGISKESYSVGCQPVCSLAPRLVLIKLFPRSPASPPPRGGSASEESTRKSWMTEGGGDGEIDIDREREREREREMEILSRFFLSSSLSPFLFSISR